MSDDVVGHLAQGTALVAAIVAVALAVRRRRAGFAALAVAVGALAVATGTLARALVDDEFGLAYVADFSRRQATTPYRLAALWGGMAGSLLFFATVAGVVGLVAAWRLRDRRAAQEVVVGVVGALVAALAGLVLWLADPFERLDLPPVDGAGLPPILEHPAMLYHPPLLYLGLATLAAPFALVVAGLRGRADADDTDTDTGDDPDPGSDSDPGDTDAGVVDLRNWLLVPWTLLAVGMVAGAHWAYVELGWGGYWAWDPVENTALLPWLAVTLALHRRGGSRGQAAFVCVAFLLALTGTMLTRSGAVPSVHAFAEDRAIGRALAVLVGVTAVAVVGLFVRTRGTRDRPRGGLVGRLLLGQLAIVGTVLAITSVGTVAPLWSDLTGGDDLAIEGRYFASFAGPLAAAGLALVALVPTALRARSRPVPPLVGVILGAGVLHAAGGHVRLPQLVLAAAAGAALASAVVAMFGPGRVGPHVAHAGLGLLLLGIAGTATGRTATFSIPPGETVEVLGREVEYLGVYVDDGRDDGTTAVVADLRIDGRARRPALVAYPNLLRVLPETSLVSTPWRDVQVALVDAADDGTAVVRVGVHPLQVWVWWGGLVVAATAAALGLEERAQRRRGLDLLLRLPDDGLGPLGPLGSPLPPGRVRGPTPGR